MVTQKRKSNGKQYLVRMGKLKGETTLTEQSYLYPKGSWTSSAARAHCARHKGKFHASAAHLYPPVYLYLLGGEAVER